MISDDGGPEVGEREGLSQPVHSPAGEITRPEELDHDVLVAEVWSLVFSVRLRFFCQKRRSSDLFFRIEVGEEASMTAHFCKDIPEGCEMSTFEHLQELEECLCCRSRVPYGGVPGFFWNCDPKSVSQRVK